MRLRSTFIIAGLLVTFGTAYVISATQNSVPKYDASGNLIDSAVSEVSGKLGVGITAPTATLDIVGNTARMGPTAYSVAAYPTSGNAYLVLDKSATGADASLLLRDQGNARAEIGLQGGNDIHFKTVTGAYGSETFTDRLVIHEGGSIDAHSGMLRNYATSGTVSIVAGNSNFASGAGLEVSYEFGNSLSRITSIERGYAYRDLVVEGNNLRFLSGSGTLAEAMRINNNGNVGLGVTSPSAKLHVGGNVVVDGNIGAKYQDIAEWVEASEAIPAGVVVITDASHSNRVRPSGAAYDTAVAGVVSAQPGILLGERGTGKVAVAQSGRVKVRVDAGYGPIKRGDLLVTSPRPGYAMRSEMLDVAGVRFHRPGTILGKALEPLEQGIGEVLTLLTLQ